MPYVISSQGCLPMEQVAAAMGTGPRWYQLYWSTDEALVDSFIQRAEAIGSEALVVTLDTTMLGWRPRDLNLGSLPFAPGIGLAQYTSDPRFRTLVAERLRGRSASPRRDTRITPGRAVAAVHHPRAPGRLPDNLRSPGRGLRSRPSSTSTPTRA